MTPNLSPEQAAWLDELAKDYGVIYANGLLMKQERDRAVMMLAQAQNEAQALREKCATLGQQLADIQDQMRGRALPRAQAKSKA